LMRLEKAINPLLDDDDMVALSFIFTTVIEDRLLKVDGSYPFHQPVNRKLQKNYYDMIEHPMDLATMAKKVKAHEYQCRADFEADVALMASNCERYNGPGSILTQIAQRIVEVCQTALDEQADTIQQLEDNIQSARQAALDAADTDSLVTSAATGDVDSVVSAGRKHSRRRPASLHTLDDMQTDAVEDDVGTAAGTAEEDFVDVVGDDEMADSIGHDLDMSPHNSDQLMLSSPDSSQRDIDEAESGAAGYVFDEMSQGATEQFSLADQPDYVADDNAVAPDDYIASQQDYASDDNAVGPDNYVAADCTAYDMEEGNSFDPRAFFESFAATRQDDVTDDLQISDSDDDDNDDDDGGLQQQVNEFADDDEASSNNDFDMAEFLKQS